MATLTLAQCRDYVRGLFKDLDITNDPAIPLIGGVDSRVDAVLNEAWVQWRAMSDSRLIDMSPTNLGWAGIAGGSRQTPLTPTGTEIAEIVQVYRLGVAGAVITAVPGNELKRLSVPEIVSLYMESSTSQTATASYAPICVGGQSVRRWRCLLYPPQTTSFNLGARVRQTTRSLSAVGDTMDLPVDEVFGVCTIAAIRLGRLTGFSDTTVARLEKLVPIHMASQFKRMELDRGPGTATGQLVA